MNVSRLAGFWERAKLGACLPVGPIELRLRLARGVPGYHPVWQRLRHWLGRRRAPAPTRPAAAIEPAPPPVTGGVAVLVGCGPGLGYALARHLAAAGMQVAMAARRPHRLEALAGTLRAAGCQVQAYGCDATRDADVGALFRAVTADAGTPELVIYNVEQFVPGRLTELGTSAFEDCWRAMTLGGFLVGREAARLMLAQGRGTILYTGATASKVGNAGYINLAVGKFGLRALAQCMARELGPSGIHVVHVVVDGAIAPEPLAAGLRPDVLCPHAMAELYLSLHRQPASAWTQELDLRPWVERF